MISGPEGDIELTGPDLLVIHPGPITEHGYCFTHMNVFEQNSPHMSIQFLLNVSNSIRLYQALDILNIIILQISRNMPPISFLDLPGEIRNIIYDQVFIRCDDDMKGATSQVEYYLEVNDNDLCINEIFKKKKRDKFISEVFAASVGLSQTCRQIRQEMHHHTNKLWSDFFKVYASPETFGRLLEMFAGLDRDHARAIKGVLLLLFDWPGPWTVQHWNQVRAVLPRAKLALHLSAGFR